MKNLCKKVVPVLLVTCFAMFIFSVPSFAAPSPTVDTTEKAFMTKLNQHRKSLGLRQLKFDRRLQVGAEWMVRDIQRRNTLSHTDSKGRSVAKRLLAFKYPTNKFAVGEVISFDKTTASSAFAAWMASSIHKGLLEKSTWRAAGVARYCVTNEETEVQQCWWTVDFGARQTLQIPASFFVS